jgi:CDP-glucose 4,6-dehydratase
VNRAQLEAAFSGRRVLVTGHTGFKGAWSVALLDALGAEVFGLALPPDAPGSLFERLRVPDRCGSVFGDLRDAGLVRDVVRDLAPEVVLHLAAQSLVRRSYRDPLTTWSTNVMGTAHLLEAIRAVDRPCRVVVVTTDKVYAESDVAHPEADPLGGADPYAASKAATELLAASYRHSWFDAGGAHGRRLATARAGNVIGAGDQADERLFPDIARAVAAERTLILRSPHAVRPWQHVLEPIVGYLELAAALETRPEVASDAFNFGPDPADALPVEELVRRALAWWGQGTSRSEPDPGAPHEASHLRIDSTRATERLGWRPRLDVDVAIRWTVDGYRASDGDLPGVVADQIDAYLGLDGRP